MCKLIIFMLLTFRRVETNTYYALYGKRSPYTIVVSAVEQDE